MTIAEAVDGSTIQTGTATDDDSCASGLTAFTDWHTTSEYEPTEAEEKAAREATLAIGNATEIDYKKSHPKAYKFNRLDKHNRDNFWRFRVDVEVSKDVDEQFKRTALLAVAHQLSLSPLQRQLALDRLMGLDLSRGGYSTKIVVFCVCAVVFNEDVEDYFDAEKPYHPARNKENNPRAFARFQTQLISLGEASKSLLQSIYRKLRQDSFPRRDGGQSRQLSTGASEVQRRPSYRPQWTNS